MEKFWDGFSCPRRRLMADLNEHADTERLLSSGMLRCAAGHLKCRDVSKEQELKHLILKAGRWRWGIRWSRGSVLACSTQVRGFKPGRSRRIFKGEKIRSTPSFGGEVKPSVPCRRFAACKRSLNGVEVVISAKLADNILAHSSHFRRWDLSRRGGRGGTWWWKVETSKKRRGKAMASNP